MNDEAVSPAAPSVGVSPSGVSAGALLRQAREASGLHIAALAVSMKVPVKKLEALEADRWESLTDAVFIRGLALSVCRTLKLDPTEVLSKLPQSITPRLGADVRGMNAPFDAGSGSSMAAVSAYVSKPAVLLVFGLLLAALVILFFPNTHNSSTVSTATVEPLQPVVQGGAVFASEPALPASEAPSVAAAPVMAPASAVASPASAAASAAVPVVTPSAAAASAASSVPVAPVSVRMASAAQVAASAPVPMSSAVQGNGAIGFKARATSWVEVTDSRKVVLIRRSLLAGEKVEVTGVLPLSVVVGASNAVAVEVRGKPFGLEQIAIDNVARFEVK